MKALDNTGLWRPSFLAHGDKLVGVVEPKDKAVAEKLANGSISGVSALIDFNQKDTKTGKIFDEVLTHVCLTDYPVITGMGEFLKLSKGLEEMGLGQEVFLPG